MNNILFAKINKKTLSFFHFPHFFVTECYNKPHFYLFNIVNSFSNKRNYYICNDNLKTINYNRKNK